MESPVPKLKRKLKDWILTAQIARSVHYACGIVGVASSCYAASEYPYARAAAIASATCFGILGYIQPMKFYHKFMSSARILENALYEFDADLIKLKDLLYANDKAENHIERLDERDIVSLGKSDMSTHATLTTPILTSSNDKSDLPEK